MAGDGVDAMWFLPSALNVKVKEFNQARVNGGSNYDSQPFREAIVGYRWVAPSVLCLLVDLVISVVGNQRQHNLERGSPQSE